MLCSISHAKLQKIAIALIGIFAILWILASVLGLYINTSNSLTKGIYIRTDLFEFQLNNKKFQKGEIVAFCPPNTKIFQEAQKRGYIGISSCTGDLGIILKQVAASFSDVITINQNGVFINGNLLEFSKPLLSDNQNRPLPQITLTNYQLQQDEVLLMTNINPYSFDSRYFGLVNTKFIKHRIRLILATD